MKKRTPWVLGIVALSSMSARAVVNISANVNNTAPSVVAPSFGYFGNVGQVNGSASGIYLGDGWVLTANHVAGSLPATATFGGIAYATQPGTWQQIKNPTGMGLSTYTDMVVFQLAAPLALPTVNLASVSPPTNDTMIMVGNGSIQEASPTFWTQTVVPGNNNDIWTETTQALANRVGYKTILPETHQVRWGLNDVASASVASLNSGGQDVRYFTSSFDGGAYADEAQAVSGDSGGGAFVYNGSSWELAGMMFAVSTYDNQPGGALTAILGQETAMEDIASYRNQIYAAIPEPSTVTVLPLLGLVGLVRRRR